MGQASAHGILGKHENLTEAILTTKSKYMAIYEWLSEQITSKAFRPGDKIPNESELSTMFGVHRMTVRQAIDKLVSDHMLVRKRGKGTYLLSEKRPVLTRSLETISTYHDDIAKAGLVPRYKTLEAKTIPADETVAAHLKVAVGSEVISLYRLMLASDVPLVLEHCFLPAELFPDLLTLSLDTVLYKIIDSVYGMNLIHSRQEIGAVMPSESERKLLKIGERCPCIWSEGVVFNDKGRAVEFTHAIYRGDKYRFKCSIGRYLCEDIAG
ncbi:MAG: GntR family transcriptional regulator [Desulfovibrio sp.]|nr:GntR family transcriptional regulator [Desulfovibrio sp.]MBI4960303.1 GntR family transcriptional regulator [Desulfovibrio sp.]